MAERMHRTQVLLEPAQHEWLVGLARTEERSVSDLIREMVDHQIQERELEAEATKQRQLIALARIAQRCEEMVEEMGGQPIIVKGTDVIDLIREERSAETFETLTGRR